MIAWTAGGLAGYALFIWVWAWWGADFYTVQNVAVPLITGPCLVLTLIEISRWVIHRARTTRARRSSFTAPVFGAAPMSQFKDGPRG
jgi:hypothetical protein